MLDALALEPQFLDHLAPVWLALPSSVRGTFLVAPELVERARTGGIEAVAQDRPPHLVHMPPPRHDGPPLLTASYGDIKEGRRLGYGPFAFLEHGAGQTYPGPNGSYAGGPDRADNELILVPSEACATSWRASYPSARVEVVGCPRLDGLPRRVPGPGPVVALSFHWPAPLSISGYAGTALGDYQPILLAVAERFTAIGHAHPKGDWPRQMERIYSRVGIPFVAEFDDVCRQADVYVCDNSSTLPEFASTGRPVVLLNAKHWHRKGSVGGRFWDWAHLGVNVDRPQDLIAGIEEALADSPERQAAREDALGIVYQPRSGGAALAAAAITSWLGTKAEVAA